MMLNSDQIVDQGCLRQVGAVKQALVRSRLPNCSCGKATVIRPKRSTTPSSPPGDFVILIIYPDAEGIEAIFDKQCKDGAAGSVIQSWEWL